MSSEQRPALINEVGTIFVPVSDQDRAVDFYVQQLGFQKRADFVYGGGLRWVEVAPSDSGIGLALVSNAEGVARPSAAARCAFATTDIDSIVARLREADIEVEDVGRNGTSRPGLVSTDVTVSDPFPPQCCFRDPDGNRFLLVQPE
jgi:catechol 2,3-dioxygenase-like lactoylglutathione lyase family enzyme